jgi:hypothetical protein
VRDLLAQPVSRARVAPRPEGALIEPFDRRPVVGLLRQNEKREIVKRPDPASSKACKCARRISRPLPGVITDASIQGRMH